VTDLKTKKIVSALSVLLIVAVAGIGLANALPRKPYALVWIMGSDVGDNVWELTYENFGLKGIAGVEVSVVGGATAAVGQYVSASDASGPNSRTAWTTVLTSSQQICWECRHAPERAHLFFYLDSTPCTLQWTLYDKNSNALMTGTVNML
jgi:hypothetical protein